MTEEKEILVSGIQPSGRLHLGNYLGAVKQFVKLQEDYKSFVFIADLHAITVPQDPGELRVRIKELTAAYLAAGLDPEESTIFQQSMVPAHSELAWILQTITSMGELERMTQFKDKSEGEKKERIKAGLFSYPTLMAADILLYDADVVPVGDDQKQHIELTRDLAERFNNRFGPTFKVPEPLIQESGARIMGLNDPENKMSKSADSKYNYVLLTDSPEEIREKFQRAVTDSHSEVKYDPENRKAISNLLNIYHLVTQTPIEELEKEYKDKSYKTLKEDIAEAVIDFLKPFQDKFSKFTEREKEINDILEQGSGKAQKIAQKKINKVKTKVGLS